MISSTRDFLLLMEKNIRFEYFHGGSTLVATPHTTEWRVLPVQVVSQLNYHSLVEFRHRKPIQILPGETITLPPGLMHKITKLKQGSGYSHWSHIQCEIFPGVSLFHLLEPPYRFKGKDSRKIGQLNEELGEIFVREISIESMLKRQALGWQLILTLLQSVAFKQDRLALLKHASRLTPVLSFIEENLASPITHELLARKANLSPSRFHTVFRDALGAAPYEYVQKVRLRRAQELLIRSDLSVGEVGRSVGHPDPFHFSRTFRRLVGVSPIKYRKQTSPGSF